MALLLHRGADVKGCRALGEGEGMEMLLSGEDGMGGMGTAMPRKGKEGVVKGIWGSWVTRRGLIPGSGL